MSGTTVSHVSDIATQQTNTTGQMTSVLDIDPSSGTMLRLLNAIAKGQEVGFPIYGKFQDGAGDDLPTDTELILLVTRPTDDQPIPVSVKETNIQAWNNLTVADQQNEQNIDAVKIELKADLVNVRDIDQLQVAINSSTAIDWSNSELYFDRNAVEKLPLQG